MSLAEFVDEMRLERLRRRIKQGAIAGELGVGQGRFCSWENHQNIPSNEVLGRWAAALGMKVPDGVAGYALADCGTDAAYYRHRRNDEQPCDSCRAAHSAAMKDWRHRRQS